jgi:phage terminase small subunit
MGNKNSGRRPQPTALKLLRGNPGKRKPNTHEPQPPAGDVAAPAGLSKAALVVWQELAPICVAMGTLTPADVRPFASLCELQSTLQQLSAAKDGKGFKGFRLVVADDDERFEIVIDGLLKSERDTANALRPYYALFGLEPVSRARIVIPPKPEEKPVSKWAGLK